MKSLLIVPALCTAIIAAPVTALAKGPKHNQSEHFTTYAKVVDVEPIYRSEVTRSPREECYYEDVSDHRGHHGHDRNTAAKMIVGGVVGGAIANEIHHGTNAKIAGAVIGSAIGHEMSHQPVSRSHRVKKRCHTVHEPRRHRHIDGYRVHYRYHGHDFVTRTKKHPGRRIKVFINVEPARARHRH